MVTDSAPPREPVSDSPLSEPAWAFRLAVERLIPAATSSMFDRLEKYRDLFLVRNAITNLSAIRDRQGVEQRLIVESLRINQTLARFLPLDEGKRGQVLDIGSGGGLPGIVIAITRPDLGVTLLDATGKKVAFMGDVIRELNLTNARPLHGRSEDIARSPRFRGAFDLATARAVASLPALIELGIPLIRERGHLLLPKGLDFENELSEGAAAADLLGATIREASILPEAGTSIESSLVVVEKTGPTPAIYPRRAGMPAREPLGRITPDQHAPRSGGRKAKR